MKKALFDNLERSLYVSTYGEKTPTVNFEMMRLKLQWRTKRLHKRINWLQRKELEERCTEIDKEETRRIRRSIH